MTLRRCDFRGCEQPHLAKGWCSKHYTRLLRHGSVDAFPEDTEGRFWAKVVKSPDCWEWSGSINKGGYGEFHIGGRGGKVVKAHRWIFQKRNGPVPDELQIDHTCRNPRCVRPDHLRLVTAKQNAENASYSQRNNTSGFRGVGRSGSKWFVQVVHDGKRYAIYGFQTAEEANQAAVDLRNSLYTHNNFDRNPAKEKQ